MVQEVLDEGFPEPESEYDEEDVESDEDSEDDED